MDRFEKNHMTKLYSLIIASALVVAACAPQAELMKTQTDVSDLRSELKASRMRIQELQKKIDAIDTNVKGTGDVQNLMADYGAKSEQLLTDIQLLQGKIEENNFRIADLSRKLDDKSFKITELSGRVEELESKVRSLSTGTTAEHKDRKQVSKPLEPSEVYRQAKNDYDRGNFDLALAGFQNYIAQFPDASQADSAQYWIAECYYSVKDYDKAIDAYSKLIKTYPRSDKVAGAKLKIGYSYLNDNQKTKAKEWLNRVLKEYPGTREAELAKDRLKKIGK